MLRLLLDNAQLFREPYCKLWYSVCAYLKRECMLVILDSDAGFPLTWVVGLATSNFLRALRSASSENFLLPVPEDEEPGGLSRFVRGILIPREPQNIGG